MLLLLSALAASAGPINAPGVSAFIRDQRLGHYEVALADLNDDGRPEALIYSTDADRCGSGGCDLYILALAASDYRLITAVSITRPPISLLPQTAHGWHDLAVRVAGGGIVPGYEARLRFNGTSYPDNPTVPPAIPLKSSSGTVLIAAASDVTETSARSASCPGQSTLEVNACLGARLEQSDAALNRYYQAAVKRAHESGSTTAQRFALAERSWIAYRDAECGAVFDFWGGTIRLSMELDCRIRLTQLRTFEIWRNWLTYPDSTPPVLPRPAIETATSSR